MPLLRDSQIPISSTLLQGDAAFGHQLSPIFCKPWEGSIHRILKKIPAMNFSLSPCNLVRCYKSAPARFRISFGSFRHLASQKWERSCVRTGIQLGPKYRTLSDGEGGRAIWNARGRGASLSPSSSLACKLFGMGKSSFSSLPYSIPHCALLARQYSQ